ncbi:MAG: choice-of-anchor Q domain-containing protein [Dehalococcoidia bacterium]|nr:choice-of-anchor Q domain-containing protein [Dehalococcoidia bacterium]
MVVVRLSAPSVALISALALFAFLFEGDLPPAHAGSFTVTKAADTADGACAADCSLREAIIAANASPGADTITLPARVYTLAIPGAGEDAAATGDLDIAGDLTISGAGAATTIIDGAGLDRVIHIVAGAVAISGLTIRNGSADGDGGGILHGGIFPVPIPQAGDLTLTSVVVTGNAGDDGGGISSAFASHGSVLTITNSAVNDNQAGNSGGIVSSTNMVVTNSTIINNVAGSAGGIFVGGYTALVLTDSTVKDNRATTGAGGGIMNSGSATITGSTISGNTATTNGGGIWASPFSGALILTNSTVSGNSARGEGGGIMISSAGGAFAAGLFNSTIAFNTADSDGDGFGGGGGIANGGPAASLKHTIIARNADLRSPSAPDCAGELDSQGHNLIQDPACPISGAFITGQDPLLGPLADNGGPTQAHALLPGSAAIDAGDNAGCPATDQRGYGRPVDGDGNGSAVCDIGAYEAGATPAASPTPTTPPGGRIWGDVDCSGGVAIGDAQKIARDLIDLAISQADGCPRIGSNVTAGGPQRLWGDIDCGGVVTIGDAQKVARDLIDLAISQAAGCPGIGETA